MAVMAGIPCALTAFHTSSDGHCLAHAPVTKG